MKLPTVRDFYREALEEFEEHIGYPPGRQDRRNLLKECAEKWDSMMEAYQEWQPKNVYQQDDPNDD